MPRKLKTRFQIAAGLLTVFCLYLIGMYFYNNRSTEKVIECFKVVPVQYYWGAVLGVVLSFAGHGIYKLDQNRDNEFSFARCFIDPQTRWPIFTNVVLGVVLVYALMYVTLLAFQEQWKLGVEVINAVITGFVVKFAVAAGANVVETRWKKEVRDESIDSIPEGQRK